MSVELRQRAQHLAEVLETHGEAEAAAQVRAALSGDTAQFEAYLRSDELWGGAGSIADQAGMREGRAQASRIIERALIELGDEQIRAGIVNVRTASWVEALRKWASSGS